MLAFLTNETEIVIRIEQKQNRKIPRAFLEHEINVSFHIATVVEY